MGSEIPTVSVVVPIYNVQDYLEECLDSILGQTLESLEVICVNDGSTDSSLEILRRYEARDERIVVIDKENGGYGHAVNRGIDRATGEWLAIVEPDDFIGETMYEDLVREAELADGGTADVVKSAYWLYFDLQDGLDPYVLRPPLARSMHPYRHEFNVFDEPEVLRHHPSIWSAIYRRSFIEDNHIRMIEPKGAGWADNPWFFETLLSARRIVWVPAAYYRYRQTNPNASSFLRDYHVPFDRLRDIRKIYDEHGITGAKMLAPLYQRSFNYICNSLLDEFHFPEADPEMMALTREVFDWMDPEIVFAKRNGITALHKDYFRDVMGLKLQKLKPCSATGHPLISIVLPLADDRKGLWRTVDSLERQRFKDFEVVCVDCKAPDRGPAIVRDIARVDGRFRLLDSQAETVGDGFNAGLDEARGDLVMFLRAGVELMDKDLLGRLAEAHGERDELGEPQVYITAQGFARLKKSRFDENELVSVFDCAGRPEVVAANVASTIFGKVFRRDYLQGTGARFLPEGDEDGHAFSVAAMCGVTRAALLSGLETKTHLRKTIRRSFLDDEDDLIALLEVRFAAMASVAERADDDATWRVARGCIVRSMADALREVGLKYSGDKLLAMLRDVFYNRHGIAEVAQPYYANYVDYHELERAFGTSPQRYWALTHATRRQQIETLRNQKAAQARKVKETKAKVENTGKALESVKKSRSYKLASGASAVYRKLLPKHSE